MKKIIIFAIICLMISIDTMAQSHLIMKRENWTFKEVVGAPTSFTKKYVPIDPAPINPKKIYYRLPAKIIRDTIVKVEKTTINNFYKNTYLTVSMPAALPTMKFMPAIEPTKIVNPFELEKQRKTGRDEIIAGGVIAGVGGTILFSQWKPTEINTKVVVNSKGVHVSAETVTYVAENTAIAIVSGAFIAGGIKLITKGSKRIKASGNGIMLVF